MKKSLLLSFCVVTGISFGQSFTAANEYINSDTQQMYLVDSAAPSLATVAGAGANWDYSAYLKMQNPLRTYQITNNTNTALFPNANKIVSVQGILSTYINSSASNRSSDGFEFTDAALGTVRANFSAGDNMNIMDYDFVLNDNSTDIFSGVLTGNGVINPACSGTSTSTFDAIGTLKLSATVTKTNVQRHHLYTELNGTSILGPVILKINQFEYYDFTTSKLPLFSYTNLKIVLNGSQATNLNFVLNTVDPISFVGINDEISKNAFSIYPNPANEELTISGDLTGNENISITDLSGKKVLFSLSDNKINISKLNAGIYFLNIEKDGQVSQEKFVKK
jgi:hypothetical protein